MKKVWQVLAFTLAFFIMIALTSCEEEAVPDTTVITLSEKDIQFESIGDTHEISSTVSNKNGIVSDPVTWSSSDEGVAIYENGVIKAVGYGYCVIRATYGDVSASCKVKVWNADIKFSLSERVITLGDIGSTRILEAREENGQDVTGAVVWSTSNASIATCQNGVIKAVNYGSCIVQATLNSQTAKCVVTVNNPNSPSINILESEFSLNSFEEFTLSYTVTATDGPITWMSSDEAIATCEDGRVQGRRKGICVITAATAEGNTDSCIITVGDYKDEDTIPGYIKFTIPEIPKEIIYISTATGKAASKAIITSYELLGEYGDDGRYYVMVKLHGTKTYDAGGLDSITPILILANLYREDDVWCSKEVYKAIGLKVGESFTVTCKLFTITVNEDGTPREFYMLLDDATEI